MLFRSPLAECFRIYQEAREMVSGLSHTARGPSMSADPGKVCILGDEMIHGEHVFILKFLQGRNPNWTSRVFFAKYDPTATWLDDLKPAFGEKDFFFNASSKTKGLKQDLSKDGNNYVSTHLDFDILKKVDCAKI